MWFNRIKKQRGEAPNLFVTLWPSFAHFNRFCHDERLAGIRLNSAMTHLYNLDNEFDLVNKAEATTPLYFDIKGRQLRVVESIALFDHLELEINHPIEVRTPCVVLFKAGEDFAILKEVRRGTRLIFEGGPQYVVQAGESMHIRNADLKVKGPIFTAVEIDRIQQVVKAGFKSFCLSYVEDQRDIDQFREFVGDAPIVAKIESKGGLEYVANKFKKKNNLSLMMARGDLFVEIDKPHNIFETSRLIIEKDPNAWVGSRLLLSLFKSEVPACSDLNEIGWLYNIGYRNFLLCDELCLEEQSLARAISVMEACKKETKWMKK